MGQDRRRDAASAFGPFFGSEDTEHEDVPKIAIGPSKRCATNSPKRVGKCRESNALPASLISPTQR